MPSTSEWAQIEAVAFTAGTAYSALRSVRHAERLHEASTTPDVHPQLLANVRTGRTDLVLVNYGGMAKGVHFRVEAGRLHCTGTVGDGFLPTSSKVHVQCDLPHDENAECIVHYRGPDEASYYASRTSERVRLRRAPRRRRRTGEMRRAPKIHALSDAWVKAHPPKRAWLTDASRGFEVSVIQRL